MPNQWRVPELFKANHWRISPERLLKLKMFHVELLRFNDKINLISKSSESSSDIIHVWDGIVAARLSRSWMEGSSISDLGSGNGIPSVVMAILNEDIQYTSIDCDERKGSFLRHIKHILKITNLRVVTGDIEKLKLSDQRFISRGFASLNKHVEILNSNASLAGLPLAVCCLKGPRFEEEIRELELKGSTWNVQKLSEYEFQVDGTVYRHNLITLSRPI